MRQLKCVIASILASSLAPIASSEKVHPEMLTPIDLSSPERAAYSLMRAMYQGDPEMVDQVFAEGATLRRVTETGELRPDGLPGWREWIGTLEIGAAHEVLFGVETETFGPLASVWAPFTITINGTLVGCGVNQFTMAQQDENWRIVFGMDTQAPQDSCHDFKDAYLANAG